MVEIDTQSFFAIVVASALAALIVGIVGRRFVLPVVVLELVFGIIIGPELLGIAQPDEFVEFFSNLGLAMLFFFAGYEIDFDRVKGRPLTARGRRLGPVAGARLLPRRPARGDRASCCRWSSWGRRWPPRRSAP